MNKQLYKILTQSDYDPMKPFIQEINSYSGHHDQIHYDLEDEPETVVSYDFVATAHGIHIDNVVIASLFLSQGELERCLEWIREDILKECSSVQFVDREPIMRWIDSAGTVHHHCGSKYWKV